MGPEPGEDAEEHRDGGGRTLENIAEDLDPVLDPVLLKQIIWGRSPKINLSDKECDYNEAFSLAITTKLPNPLYTPEPDMASAATAIALGPPVTS